MTKGVVLAGGLGTRLGMVSKIYNKHLALVYDKAMVMYPIRTLKSLGVTDIVIISGGENIGGFSELLGDGSDIEVSLTYRVQRNAGGIAEALRCCEGLVDGVFPVILGDNYFDAAFPGMINPSIFITIVPNANEYGIYHKSSNQIVEKPSNDLGNWAVTGLYYYDEKVFDYIDRLTYSSRGELEITDVNNYYLKDNNMVVNYLMGYWKDMGTPQGLLAAANRESSTAELLVGTDAFRR